MKSPEDNLIALEIEKEIKNLFKYYLELLEDLKLEQNQHDSIRKKILDSSNDTLREILNFLNYFDFTINPQRVEELAQKQRVIYKKTIYCPPVII